MKISRFLGLIALVAGVGFLVAEVVQAATPRSTGPAGRSGVRLSRAPYVVTPPGGYAGQVVPVENTVSLSARRAPRTVLEVLRAEASPAVVAPAIEGATFAAAEPTPSGDAEPEVAAATSEEPAPTGTVTEIIPAGDDNTDEELSTDWLLELE